MKKAIAGYRVGDHWAVCRPATESRRQLGQRSTIGCAGSANLNDPSSSVGVVAGARYEPVQKNLEPVELFVVGGVAVVSGNLIEPESGQF
jgi:hypothetical protein